MNYSSGNQFILPDQKWISLWTENNSSLLPCHQATYGNKDTPKDLYDRLDATFLTDMTDASIMWGCCNCCLSQRCLFNYAINLVSVCLFGLFLYCCQAINQQKVLMGHNIWWKLASVISLLMSQRNRDYFFICHFKSLLSALRLPFCLCISPVVGSKVQSLQLN